MHTQSKPYGFSLIELMVAVVITSLTAIIMFQVLFVSERQRTITGGSSDAQTHGTIATDQLEREIRMAGFGMTDVIKVCNPATTYTYFDSGTGAPATPVDGFGVTVQVLDSASNPPGADPNTDAITIPIPATNFDSNFKQSQFALTHDMTAPDAELRVSSTYSCEAAIPGRQAGLLLMVQPATVSGTPGGSCTLMQVSEVDEPNLKLKHEAPSGGASYNPPAAYQTANGWPAYKRSDDPDKNAYGLCFGRPSQNTGGSVTFRVSNQQLLRADANGTAAVAGQIVSLQAEYGLVAGKSGSIAYQAPSGAWATPGAFTQAQIRQVKAIRISLVARSAEFEKPEPGLACTTSNAASVAGLSAWANHTPAISAQADWQCYRYKVFETVVPLRNVILANV